MLFAAVVIGALQVNINVMKCHLIIVLFINQG